MKVEQVEISKDESVVKKLMREESTCASWRTRKHIVITLFTFLVLCIGSLIVWRFFIPSEKQDPIAISVPVIPSIALSTPVAGKKERIGFLPSWTVANRDPVYPKYFTQLVYFGLGVTRDGDIITQNAQHEPVLEWTYFLSDDFEKIRQEASRSGTKIILAIKCFDNETIDTLISSPNATTRFTNQLLAIIEKYNLNGVNIDFEYVTDSDFPTAKYLVSFLKTVTEKLKNDNQKYTVSFDVNATSIKNDRAYDMKAIGESVDQIIFMAYDFRRQDATVAGPTAPLDKINETVLILQKEVPPEKIILGIPLYGYEWQTYTSIHKSTTIEDSGALASYKRVKKIVKENTTVSSHWDALAKSPWLSYMIYGIPRQIYYEDDRSIAEKVRYSGEKHLGGTAFWALGYDSGDEILWSSLQEVVSRD